MTIYANQIRRMYDYGCRAIFVDIYSPEMNESAYLEFTSSTICANNLTFALKTASILGLCIEECSIVYNEPFKLEKEPKMYITDPTWEFHISFAPKPTINTPGCQRVSIGVERIYNHMYKKETGWRKSSMEDVFSVLKVVHADFNTWTVKEALECAERYIRRD